MSRGGKPQSRIACWQARRESNPQPPVLETGALPIELLAYTQLASWRAGELAHAITNHQVTQSPSHQLLRLLVGSVLPAEAAELRELQSFRCLLLVLRRAVVAPLTLG